MQKNLSSSSSLRVGHRLSQVEFPASWGVVPGRGKGAGGLGFVLGPGRSTWEACSELLESP